LRGREGGRYNHRWDCCGRLRGHDHWGFRSFPGPSPGLFCVARLRARTHKASQFARSNLWA